MADPLRVTAWDIEASNLAADFGIVLCVGFKDVGTRARPLVISLYDYFTENDKDLIRAERRMLKDVYARLMDSDTWLTHYGVRYDAPFVNSRLMYHGMKTLPPSFPHIDTWRVSKYQLKLRNNRLATIQQHLQLEDEKNAIRPEQWIRCLSGHAPSMNYIIDHCRRDVLVLEQAYLRLRPLVKGHPNGNLLRQSDTGCPVCGSETLQSRGFQIAMSRKYRRYQCQSCGSWSKKAHADKTASRRSA